MNNDYINKSIENSFNIPLQGGKTLTFSKEKLNKFYLKKNKHNNGYQLKEYVLPIWMHRLWMLLKNSKTINGPTYFYSDSLVEKITTLASHNPLNKIKAAVDPILSLESLEVSEEEVEKSFSLQDKFSEQIQEIYKDRLEELEQLLEKKGDLQILTNKNGTQLKYVIKEIGGGAYGTVYASFHLQKEETRVLKLGIQGRSEETEIQLQREFDLLSTIHGENSSLWGVQDKPHKIKQFFLHKKGSSSPKTGLMVERCLYDLWEYNKENGGLDIFKLFFIAHQMLSGLQRVHNAGIAHMDIKTENFLVKKLVEEGLPIVQIADFGGSIKGEALQKLAVTKMCMTEQDYEDEKKEIGPKKLLEIGKKHDVFSIGLSIYETFAKGHSFIDEQTSFCRTDLYVPLFKEENPLDHLLEKMLSMDRNKRPTVTEALERLEKMMGDESLNKIRSIQNKLKLF